VISIVIPTKNEEQNLPGCLRSVEWCDDVHVFDCGSTDGTVQLAERMGASVTTRSYPASLPIFGGNEAEHKNWGLQHIPFKYPWVFQLDADERVTHELAFSLISAVQSPGDNVAFRVCRRDFLHGRWLKHVQTSPYYLRLFRPERMRYERLINPVSIPDGPVSELSGYLDHLPFSKGMRQWLDRHNSYSTLEAQQIMANRTAHKAFSLTQAFVAADFHERRFHQKELFYRLPARPLVKFALLYLLKRGFLDGGPGFTYAVLQSIYEYMIVLKTSELEEGVLEPSAATLSETTAGGRY
jgi:glycosyltransferase involved in cell wall biosynthesis